MLKIGQNGRKASSGKETESLTGASSGLPPLPRASSITPSCSSLKGKQGKSLEYSKTRERNLRYTRRMLETRHTFLGIILRREIERSPNAHLVATFHGGSFVHFMDKVSSRQN